MTQITTLTHREPEILECKVKWALGSITRNKASGGDRIPVELFQILKDDVKVLHSICQEIWETQQWPQDWKRSVFIPIPKKGNAKECSTTTQLHSSHMLAKECSKFSKPGFNSTSTENFQMFKLNLEKAEEPEIKLPKYTGSLKKQESSRKNIYFCFIDYAKAFDCVDHNKLWKILKEVGLLDHLTCFLRNLYAGQEATVRTGHGIMDWFQIGKGVRQGCILSPCLFNLHAEHIMKNARLDEAQAGIKIAGRSINNLRYADDTTFIAENEEKLLFT